MTKFEKIKERAEHRKGGGAALKKLLPKVASKKKLIALGDDRYFQSAAAQGNHYVFG